MKIVELKLLFRYIDFEQPTGVLELDFNVQFLPFSPSFVGDFAHGTLTVPAEEIIDYRDWPSFIPKIKQCRLLD